MKNIIVKELKKLGVKITAGKVRTAAVLEAIKIAEKKESILATGSALDESHREQIVEVLMDFFVHSKNKTHVEFEEEEIEEAREEINNSLEFDAGRWSSLGDQATVTFDGVTYSIMPSEDAAEKIAEQVVHEDAEESPENFNKDFVKQYLFITDTDRGLIANDEADSRVQDLSDTEILKEADMVDEYEEAPSEKEAEAILENAKDALRDAEYERVKTALKDPIQYFVEDLGAYSVDELLKATFISIDTKEMAKDAVSTDGWAHFLSLYDGDYEILSNKMVIFRED